MDEIGINDVFVQKGQLPLSAQSAFCAIPTSRDASRQFTYFNNERKVGNSSLNFIVQKVYVDK